MKLRGIKRGQNIEILGQLNNIPDGTEMIIEVGLMTNQIKEIEPPLTDEERLARINQLFGAWKNQPELTEIFSELRKIGKPTGEFDALIASVARSRDDILVTNNTKDFENIPNLKLDNWLEP